MCSRDTIFRTDTRVSAVRDTRDTLVSRAERENLYSSVSKLWHTNLLEDYVEAMSLQIHVAYARYIRASGSYRFCVPPSRLELLCK